MELAARPPASFNSMRSPKPTANHPLDTELTDSFEVVSVRLCRGASFDKIIPRIIQKLKDTKYDAILLDPLYKIYGEIDENKAGDVALLMNELETLAVKSKAAVLFGAHFSKGNQAGKESIDRVSGSGVYARDPDSILNFTRHEEEEAFVVESNLRNLIPLEKFVVRWQYPLMVRDDCLNPAKLKTGISRSSGSRVGEFWCFGA